MFDEGAISYKSDLDLGKKYRDKTTGIEGTLVGVFFYEHACERGMIRYVDGNQRVVETTFDAPELVDIETGEPAQTTKTGGPDRGGQRTGNAR